MLRRKLHTWDLGKRSLALGKRTIVMGIVNLTPDSFSGDGLAGSPDVAVERALRMLEDGAEILDLGAESTRPGSKAGTADALGGQQEQDRLLPVLEALRRERPSALLSVDTYRAATARTALAAGADIVNDVSGFLWDRAMAGVCAASGCGVVLMHTRGLPDEWAQLPPLADDAVEPLVHAGLVGALRAAAAAGIAEDRVVLDPGYGFGKGTAGNYALLARQRALLELDRPILAGLSRKSFLGQTLARRYGLQISPSPGERDHASAAAAVAAVLQGAGIVRVHAVRETVEAVAVADQILAHAEN